MVYILTSTTNNNNTSIDIGIQFPKNDNIRIDLSGNDTINDTVIARVNTKVDTRVEKRVDKSINTSINTSINAIIDTLWFINLFSFISFASFK